MSINFEKNSWPFLKECIEKNALVLMPIGAIEQHGPHLPIDTDMTIARKISEAVAQKLNDKFPVLVTPDLWPAYNGKYIQKNWPGSLTVSQNTQKNLLYDITISLIEMGFRKIMYLNSHGQNLFTMEAVIRKIADNYNIHIPYIFEYNIIKDFMAKERKSEEGGMCHACEVETSLMLYLTDLVQMDKAEKNLLKYRSKFRNTDGAKSSKVFWSTWGLETTKTGVFGDPTVATKDMGKKLFKYIIENISEFAEEYYNYK